MNHERALRDDIDMVAGGSVKFRMERNLEALLAEKDAKVEQLREELDAWTTRVVATEERERKVEAALFALLDRETNGLGADRVVTAERGSVNPIESIAKTLERRAQQIKALADALESARTAMHRGEFGDKGRDRHVPAQVDAALRLAGR